MSVKNISENESSAKGSLGQNQSKKGSTLTIYFDREMKKRMVVQPDMRQFDRDWNKLAHDVIGIYPFYKWVVS
jgi:hypothetical protein